MSTASDDNGDHADELDPEAARTRAVGEAAGAAIVRGDLATAAAVLDGAAAGSAAAAARPVLHALVRGDAELAFAALDAWNDRHSCEPALREPLASAVAAALAAPSWERRLLAIAAVGPLPWRGELCDQLADDLGVPRAATASFYLGAAALALGVRRAGDHPLFARLAAVHTDALAPPALIRAGLACGQQLIAGGSCELAVWTPHAIAAILAGRQAELERDLAAAFVRGGEPPQRLKRQLALWSSSAKREAGQVVYPSHGLVDDHELAALEREPLGELMIVSGAVTICDPCYAPPIAASITGYLAGVLPGRWCAHVWRTRASVAGSRRIAFLVMSHRDHAYDVAAAVWNRQADVGVDAGMAGIFDAAHYRDEAAVANEVVTPFNAESRWFDLCANRALGEAGAGVIPFGCVSTSGLGDGMYDAYAVSRDVGIVAVALDFQLAARGES